MHIWNGSETNITVVVDGMSVWIPQGQRIQLAGPINGVYDDWTLGEATLVYTNATQFGVARDASVVHDYFYGVSAGLPLAVVFLMLWAVMRGLRPSLDQM